MLKDEENAYERAGAAAHSMEMDMLKAVAASVAAVGDYSTASAADGIQALTRRLNALALQHQKQLEQGAYDDLLAMLTENDESERAYASERPR